MDNPPFVEDSDWGLINMSFEMINVFDEIYKLNDFDHQN